VWVASASYGGGSPVAQAHGGGLARRARRGCRTARAGNPGPGGGTFSSGPAVACRGSVPPVLRCDPGHGKGGRGDHQCPRGAGVAAPLLGVGAGCVVTGDAEPLGARSVGVGGGSGGGVGGGVDGVSGCSEVKATWMTPPARSVRIAVSALTEWTNHGRCWRPRRTVVPGRGRWPSTPVVWMTVRAVLAAATATRVAASSASAVSGTANVISTVTNRSPGSTVAVSPARPPPTSHRRRVSGQLSAGLGARPSWRT
jgi:hypothetical protein